MSLAEVRIYSHEEVLERISDIFKSGLDGSYLQSLNEGTIDIFGIDKSNSGKQFQKKSIKVCLACLKWTKFSNSDLTINNGADVFENLPLILAEAPNCMFQMRHKNQHIESDRHQESQQKLRLKSNTISRCYFINVAFYWTDQSLDQAFIKKQLFEKNNLKEGIQFQDKKQVIAKKCLRLRNREKQKHVRFMDQEEEVKQEANLQFQLASPSRDHSNKAEYQSLEKKVLNAEKKIIGMSQNIAQTYQQAKQKWALKKFDEMQQHKNTFCQLWFQGKECPDGINCFYAHGFGELQPYILQREFLFHDKNFQSLMRNRCSRDSS